MSCICKPPTHTAIDTAMLNHVKIIAMTPGLERYRF